MRAEAEDLKLSPDALSHLCDIGQQKSLRYAIQLLTPSKILSQVAGREIIEVIIVCSRDASKMNCKFLKLEGEAKSKSEHRKI